MTDNHRLALEKLKTLHSNRPEVIALIICGSLARKQERDDSDIDLYLVYTDEAFEEVGRRKSFFYGTWEPQDFFGICIDGKIVSMEFLREAVQRASEPTRASFIDAYSLFTKSPEVDELLPKIAVYPEHDQFRRAQAFFNYVKHYRYVGEEAHSLKNEFWYRHCIIEFIFFSGRLILAHNRRLFSCHKALFREVAQCKDMPEGIVAPLMKLFKSFSYEEMVSCFDVLVEYFGKYDYPDLERIGHILEDEQAWFSGNVLPRQW